MESKEIKITCPKGYEYYIENDTIKFKKKEITWQDICAEVVSKQCFGLYRATGCYDVPYACENDTQYFKAYHKLKCIADYFNSNPNKEKEWRYIIRPFYDVYGNVNHFGTTFVSTDKVPYVGAIYFNNEDDAKQAVKIMGDDLKWLF